MTVASNYFSADYTKPSLASAEISVAGQSIRGVVKFSFKETVKADPQYGNGSTSEGTSIGQHSAEGSLGLFTNSAAALRQILGAGWYTTFLTVSCSLFEPNGAGLLTYTATRVRIGELEFDPGEPGGNAVAKETYAVTIHDPINWDGIPGIFLPGSIGFVPVQLPTLSIFG